MTGNNEIIIIGGGVAGYPAAIKVARMGASVTLVEKEKLGGVCLNKGCIPTKTLLQSAAVVQTIKDANLFGIQCEGFVVDFARVMRRKKDVVSRLTQGVQMLLAAKKVKVIKGTAVFIDTGKIKILETGEILAGRNILIATGSKPGSLPIKGLDLPEVLNSDQVLELEQLPESVIIIGGGVIGVEFAQFFRAMGASVSIVEMQPNIVPGIDLEIAKLLERKMKQLGVQVITQATVQSVEKSENQVVVKYRVRDKEEHVKAEKVILTVGRKPDFSALNIEKAGIRHEKGAILVDSGMRTNVPGIYAAGDVIGGIMLAHVASAEGECAVANALGHNETMDYKAIPACIYTKPEVASVGLSEEEARKKHINIQVGKFPLGANGKAVVLNETDGLVKIISEPEYGEILGVHILGPHATDMIAEAVLGMNMEMTAEMLAGTIHPHPTVSEALMEAAQVLNGGATHLP